MGATMSRFEGIRSSFKQRPNGGIGAFTPDNLPVLDWVAPNVYMIEDSNHGFKMIGLGKLVSKLLMGEGRPGPQALRLQPLLRGQDLREQQQPLAVGVAELQARLDSGPTLILDGAVGTELGQNGACP